MLLQNKQRGLDFDRMKRALVEQLSTQLSNIKVVGQKRTHTNRQHSGSRTGLAVGNLKGRNHIKNLTNKPRHET